PELLSSEEHGDDLALALQRLGEQAARVLQCARRAQRHVERLRLRLHHRQPVLTVSNDCRHAATSPSQTQSSGKSTSPTCVQTRRLMIADTDVTEIPNAHAMCSSFSPHMWRRL